MSRVIRAYIRWLAACALLIVQRLGVILCLPLLWVTTFFFMHMSDKQTGYAIEGASYFWRKLPPRPVWRKKRRKKAGRLTGEILPPISDGSDRLIP